MLLIGKLLATECISPKLLLSEILSGHSEEIENIYIYIYQYYIYIYIYI